MKKKWGYFGGSFDPIHNGHINIALALKEKHQLDRVLFCPTSLSPFKIDAPPSAEASHRKKMVELAIEPLPFFSLCDHELNTSGPHYTIDTLRHLAEQNSKENIQYYILFAEDLLADFSSWKDYQEIVDIAIPLIGTRSEREPFLLDQYPEKVARALREGRTKINNMQISSTYLRKRLKEKLYCGHLVPAKVLDYIESNHLY